jgi:cobalt-zinc-cadmium efflux system protein
MAHNHHHEISASGKHKNRLVAVLLLSFLYLIVEVVGGYITGSLALFADAGHMLTDVAGLGLALFAIKIAGKPANPKKTYGYYRAEIFAALANGVFLLCISVFILFEAYQRFLHPPVVESKPMLIIAIVGLAVNIASVFLLRQGAEHSINVKGAYYEVLSDMLTSIGVIVAGIVMLLAGWYYADPIISAAIGLFIFPRTWQLIKEATAVLLEGTPKDVDLDNLRKCVLAIPGVENMHDLHVWSLTSGVNAMSAHIVIQEDVVQNEILKKVTELIASEFKISHTTLQLELPGYEEKETHL